MALWVKTKRSQHIVVMENRVQRILAIEARAGQGEKIGGYQITMFSKADRTHSTIQLRPLLK